MSHTTSYKVPSGALIELTAKSKAYAPLEVGLTFRFTGDATEVDKQTVFSILEDFKRVKTFNSPTPGDRLVSIKLKLDGIDEDKLDGYISSSINDLFAAIRHAFEPSGTRNTTNQPTKGRKLTTVKRDFAKSKQ